MRQRDDDELVDRIAENVAELADALVVRAVPAADRDRALIEPDHIAALQAPWFSDFADHRNIPDLERRPLCRRLPCPLRLAHAAEDHAAIAHDRRVTDVDGIQARPGRLRQEMQPRVGLREQIEEAIVFGKRLRKIRGLRERGQAASRRDWYL